MQRRADSQEDVCIYLKQKVRRNRKAHHQFEDQGLHMVPPHLGTISLPLLTHVAQPQGGMSTFGASGAAPAFGAASTGSAFGGAGFGQSSAASSAFGAKPGGFGGFGATTTTPFGVRMSVRLSECLRACLLLCFSSEDAYWAICGESKNTLFGMPIKRVHTAVYVFCLLFLL